MKQLLKTQVNSTNEESSHNNRSQQERGRGGDQGRRRDWRPYDDNNNFQKGSSTKVVRKAT